jgi:multidrug resistance efflux pump
MPTFARTTPPPTILPRRSRSSICGAAVIAISVPNAQPNNQGVATVNPIFTWVRLARRIPVSIRIDEVPPGVVLVAGMTATVEIDDRSRAPVK